MRMLIILPPVCIPMGSTGLRPGMPRGPAGAARLQTLHTKLPYITLVWLFPLTKGNMGAAWR